MPVIVSVLFQVLDGVILEGEELVLDVRVLDEHGEEGLVEDAVQVDVNVGPGVLRYIG